MFDLDDIDTIESDEAASFDDIHASIQRAINAGLWALQGSYGRTMMGAIEDGACLLGTKAARDYWGNRIPSRDEVQQGTKGSFDYVADAYGIEHAEAMAAID
jgi:hypothetical protein